MSQLAFRSFSGSWKKSYQLIQKTSERELKIKRKRDAVKCFLLGCRVFHQTASIIIHQSSIHIHRPSSSVIHPPPIPYPSINIHPSIIPPSSLQYPFNLANNRLCVMVNYELSSYSGWAKNNWTDDERANVAKALFAHTLTNTCGVALTHSLFPFLFFMWRSGSASRWQCSSSCNLSILSVSKTCTPPHNQLETSVNFLFRNSWNIST